MSRRISRRRIIGRVFRTIHKAKISKWFIVGMFVGEVYYQVPARTYDIDICLFLDPEEDRLEFFLKKLVKVLRVRREDITPWDEFMRKIREGQTLVIEPLCNIDFHIDIIPITPENEFYAVFREAYDNRIAVKWGKMEIQIPTREYWICLKLVGFRSKDKYHLIEMLRSYNILGLKINVKKLNAILSKYPILRTRWNELLKIAESEYGLYIDKDGRILKR